MFQSCYLYLDCLQSHIFSRCQHKSFYEPLQGEFSPCHCTPKNALYGRAHDPMVEEVASWIWFDGRARSRIHSCFNFNSYCPRQHRFTASSQALHYKIRVTFYCILFHFVFHDIRGQWSAVSRNTLMPRNPSEQANPLGNLSWSSPLTDCHHLWCITVSHCVWIS